MAFKIQFRRGNKVNLPVLDNGEVGYTQDTNELYIGATGGNKKLTFDADKYASYDSQLADIKTKRKLKVPVYASPYWLDGSGNARPQSFIQSDLDDHKKMGVDGIVLMLHVELVGGVLQIKETLANIQYGYNYAKSIGLDVIALKVHHGSNGYVTSSQYSDYTNMINQICVAFQGNIKYFFAFNEWSIWQTNDTNSAEYAFVNNTLTSIKSYGFTTGISFSGGQIINTLPSYSWVINAIGVIGSNNGYCILGNKAQNTTYADSILGWKNWFDSLKYYKNHYNKSIILTESGCTDDWETLWNPADYNYIQVSQTHGGAQVLKTFFYGLFEHQEIETLLDCIFIFYTTDEAKYQEFYDFVNSYTNNDMEV